MFQKARRKTKYKFIKILSRVFLLLFILILIFFSSIFLIKKFIYPLKYINNIENANKENGSNIDPYLILSIIKTESGFNEQAISR